MSEFQPQEPTEIQFSLGNHEFSFTPEDNPRVFTHDDPTYDHLIYINNWHNGEPQTALVFFREVFDAHGVDMDELMEFLMDEDIEFVPQGDPADVDIMIYEHFCKGRRRLPVVLKLTNDEVPHLDYGGETAGTEQEPSQELVHVPREVYEIPHPEENWGNTKKAQAEKWGGFVAYLAESIANGDRAE